MNYAQEMLFLVTMMTIRVNIKASLISIRIIRIRIRLIRISNNNEG